MACHVKSLFLARPSTAALPQMGLTAWAARPAGIEGDLTARSKRLHLHAESASKKEIS
jgi:hypothetical protein